jgi:hypothetical protein
MIDGRSGGSNLFCTAATETQGNTDPSSRLDRQMPNSAYSKRTHSLRKIWEKRGYNAFQGVHSADQWAPTSTFPTSMCYTSTALYFNREWLRSSEQTGFAKSSADQRLCTSTKITWKVVFTLSSIILHNQSHNITFQTRQ